MSLLPSAKYLLSSFRDTPLEGEKSRKEEQEIRGCLLAFLKECGPLSTTDLVMRLESRVSPTTKMYYFNHHIKKATETRKAGKWSAPRYESMDFESRLDLGYKSCIQGILSGLSRTKPPCIKRVYQGPKSFVWALARKTKWKNT